MQYIYEAILTKESDDAYDGYSVVFPDWGSATCGVTLKEATLMAADLLRGDISYALANGNILPRATFGNNAHEGTTIIVSVSVTQREAEEEWSWMSTIQAAEALGVTPGRVRVMAHTGVLPSKREGRDIRILRSAVQERIQHRPGPGRRPRTDLATT